MKIAISKIRYSKGFNPRESIDQDYVKSLSRSLKSTLQIEPITLQAKSCEIIDGLHRVSACKLAKIKEIECRLVNVSDLEARELALVSNIFGRKLSHLEIGKAADRILSEVPKRTGREKAKRDLVKKLGLTSVSVLEDCLTSYRGISPEARTDISTAVETGAIGLEDLRQIRKFPPAEQKALTTLIGKQDNQKETRQVIQTFVDTHSAISSPIKADTPAVSPQKSAPEQFFPIHKDTFSLRVTEPINLTVLLQKFTAFLTAQIGVLERKHLSENDLLTVTLVLETPHAKTQKVAAIARGL
jgi:ParB/RepB/Spo0J family partition protein